MNTYVVVPMVAGFGTPLVRMAYVVRVSVNRDGTTWIVRTSVSLSVRDPDRVVAVMRTT
jgi:hypothetical protein